VIMKYRFGECFAFTISNNKEPRQRPGFFIVLN
jgi:hypothetical protein